MRTFSGLPGTALSGPANLAPGVVPSAAVKAKRCYFPVSRWVHAFILTCDDKLAVWFKRRPRRALGVPGICCLYPQSDGRLYDLAVAWPSAGRFVHRFLYRLMAYVVVAPPKSPCGTDCPPGVVVTCCDNALPATLHVTFTGAITGSAVLTAVPGGPNQWEGTTSLCGETGLNVSLICEAGTWALGVGSSLGGCYVSQTAASSAVCSPLALTFALTGQAGHGCCGGVSFTATVTP